MQLNRLGFDGAARASEALCITVPPRSVALVPVPVEIATATEAAAELVRASVDHVHGHWFFAEYRHSALEPDRFDARSSRAMAASCCRSGPQFCYATRPC